MHASSGTGSQEAQKARRKSSRVVWVRPVIVQVDTESVYLGHSLLLSVSGMSMRLPRLIAKGRKVKIQALVDGQWCPVEGKVVFQNQPLDSRFSDLFEIGVAFLNPVAGSHLWQAGKVYRSAFESTAEAVPE